MSKYIIILLITIISSCGFKSVYKNNDIANIETPKNKLGYMLKQNLENIAQLPEGYTLKIDDINYDKKTATYSKSREKLRYNIITTASFTLLDGEKKIISDTEKVTTNYNVTTSDYNNLIAEENAVKRGIKELAEQISKKIL